MTRILLMRGMLAGLVAGFLLFALARWIGEPQVERAIAFESNTDQAKGGMADPEIFTRRVQKSFGLLTATVLDGTAMGGIFALVFAFAYGRLPVRSPRSLSVLLAGLAFVTLVVVPARKYPPDPPSVGNPETIGIRTAAYFLLLVLSVAGMVIAVQIERRLHNRLDVWNAVLVAATFFVVFIATVAHFLPDFDEVPAGFPATLMWKFRIAALEMQVALWTVLGLFFGWLAARVGSRVPSFQEFPEKQNS